MVNPSISRLSPNCVRGGFVIGILFPKNYAPFIMKFKEKPFIPTGFPGRNTTVTPPGHFQLYYNRIARQAGIEEIYGLHKTAGE